MGFYMKNKWLLFLFVAMTMLSVSFISCSSDDDSSNNGGGGTSYAFQGKTYSGYTGYTYVTIRFNSNGNGLSSSSSEKGVMYGTYTVQGNIIIITWDETKYGTDSIRYDSNRDSLFWGDKELKLS